MSYSFANRKRVRGWGKNAQKIDHLKVRHLKINLPLLEKYGNDHVELTISPWSNFTPRNPPFWYRRLFLDALVEIYDSWEKQLKEIASEYYLKIWLSDPHFHAAQIVAGIGDEIEQYKNRFLTNEKLSPKPPKEYDSKLFSVGNFRWEPKFHTITTFEKGDELTEKQIKYCKAHSVLIEQTEDDTIYFVKRGNLWVGEKI